MDSAQASLQPVPLPLAGKVYNVKPRSLAELGELQAWFKASVESPLQRVSRALPKSPMPHALKEVAIQAAVRLEQSWPPRVGSLAWRQAVDDADLGHHVVLWAIRPCHPEATEDEARAVLNDATADELATLQCLVFTGSLPDPKSTGATTSPPTTTAPESPN